MSHCLILRADTVALADFERIDMKTRIITAIVAFSLLVPVLIFSDTVALPIAVAFFAILAVWEIANSLGMRKKWYYTVPSVLYALLVSLLTADFWYRGIVFYLALLFVVTFIYMMIVFVATVFANGKEAFSSAAQLIVGTAYATVGLASVVLLRGMENGQVLFLLPLLGAWLTDIGAYFVGVFFGKHKLCPAISPKKTVEGSVGGLIFGAAAFAVYGLVLHLAFDMSPNYLMLVGAGLLVSFVSQMGDLTASLLKREHGVKDFGNIFPGHGGVMDRVDSLIVVAPLLVVLCLLPQNFAFFF